MTEGHAGGGSKGRESGGATEGFSGSVGVRELEGNGGDVGDGVEVFSA